MAQSPQDPAQAQIQRIQSVLLLSCCIALLVAGVAVKILPGFESGSREFFSGTLLKVAMVVGLTWVAAPQLHRLGWEKLRGTGLVVMLVIGVLVAIRPRLGAIAMAVVVGGFITLSVLGWVRGVMFNGGGTSTISRNTGKIEKNPTKR